MIDFCLVFAFHHQGDGRGEFENRTAVESHHLLPSKVEEHVEGSTWLEILTVLYGLFHIVSLEADRRCGICFGLWRSVEEVDVEVGGFFCLIVEPKTRANLAVSRRYRHIGKAMWMQCVQREAVGNRYRTIDLAQVANSASKGEFDDSLISNSPLSEMRNSMHFVVTTQAAPGSTG